MTPEQLHDALTQLPSDLIAETDAKRSRSTKRVIPFRRYAAMAACLGAVILSGLILSGRLLPGGGKSSSAPAAMEGIVYQAEEAAPEEPADCVTQAAGEFFGEAGNSAEAPAEAAEDSAQKAPESPADFALSLFRNSLQREQNTLVSPLSVLSALGMTANGANGETLAQMEAAMGMPIQALNSYLHAYADGQNSQLMLSNALWLRDSEELTVEQSFLDTAADLYRAEVFRSAFDSAALTQINRWVEEKTNGMIPKILDTLPEDAAVYLINALAFEGQWEDPYKAHQVHEGEFTTASGETRTVELMYSQEGYYLEDDQATGFLKYYEDRKYAFVALLPKEDVSIADYVSSLTGERLQALLDSPTEITVHAALPKFQAEYSAELSVILKQMGMTDAFDPAKADFSRLGSSAEGNLYISRVIHKTFLAMAEEGTRAGAATAVEMVEGAAFEPEAKFVTLDRPFVYLLIDCEDNLPFFLGALMNPGASADASLQDFSDPPVLTAAGTEDTFSVQPGNYTWEYDGNTIIACGAAPLDLPEDAPALQVNRTVRLLWDGKVPDSVEAVGWNPETGAAKPLTVTDSTVVMDADYPICEITACWEGCGFASYVFRISCE